MSVCARWACFFFRVFLSNEPKNAQSEKQKIKRGNKKTQKSKKKTSKIIVLFERYFCALRLACPCVSDPKIWMPPTLFASKRVSGVRRPILWCDSGAANMASKVLQTDQTPPGPPPREGVEKGYPRSFPDVPWTLQILRKSPSCLKNRADRLP